MNNYSSLYLLLLLLIVQASSQALTTTPPPPPNKYLDWNSDIVANLNIENPSCSVLSSTLNTQSTKWYRAKAFPTIYSMA